jgi:alpha-mannosidase
LVAVSDVQAQKRIYIADDNHTDEFYSLPPYRQDTAFTNQLTWYMRRAYATSGLASDYQQRYACDGWYWVNAYEKTKSAAQKDSLWAKILDGHISFPMQPIPQYLGPMSAEVMIRGSMKVGQWERQRGYRVYIASSIENQTRTFGSASVWAGMGAKYSWNGVCACVTLLDYHAVWRPREIYYAKGYDNRSLLTKWNSMNGLYGTNQDIGGYAEGATNLRASMGYIANNAGWISHWPQDSVKGIFGYGWDQVSSYTTLFSQVAQDSSNANRRVICSNMVDFFDDYAAHPASTPTYNASFGNDWDGCIASLAEVTAQVRRSVESMRTAEAVASVVALVDTIAISALKASRDSSYLYSGFYFHNNWQNDGSFTVENDDSARVWSARIKRYPDNLLARCGDTLASRIRKTSDSVMFYAFNPLSWRRTDAADFRYSPPAVFRVIETKSGAEIRSQKITKSGVDYVRILAVDVPSVGYKTYRLERGVATAFTDSAAHRGADTLSNSRIRLRLSTGGDIVYLYDIVGAVNMVSGGGLDSLNASRTSGAVTFENGGSVSTTIVSTVVGTPNRTVKVTLYYGSPRVDIQNEITQNFTGNPPLAYSYRFNLTSPRTYHEEVGAILKVSTVANGGGYSTRTVTEAKYDYLSLGHFVALNNGTSGVTVSNWDSQFFVAGNSNVTTLDSTSSLVKPVVGGILASQTQAPTGQFGDSYFLNRYAVQREAGAFSRINSMRFALEHQTPFYTDTLKGNSSGWFTDTAYTYLSVSDTSIFLWALKPVQELPRGVAMRFWSMRSDSVGFTLTIPKNYVDSSYATTHLETDLAQVTHGANTVSAYARAQGMETFRAVISKGAADAPVVQPSGRYLPFYRR